MRAFPACLSPFHSTLLLSPASDHMTRHRLFSFLLPRSRCLPAAASLRLHDGEPGHRDPAGAPRGRSHPNREGDTRSSLHLESAQCKKNFLSETMCPSFPISNTTSSTSSGRSTRLIRRAERRPQSARCRGDPCSGPPLFEKVMVVGNKFCA